MTNTSTFEVFKYSLLIAAGLIIYFLLMAQFQLTETIELRFMNFFIVFIGLFAVIKRSMRGENANYLRSFGRGALVGILSSVLFGFFMFIYLRILNPDFMLYLNANAPFGELLSPGSAAMVVMMEGAASSMIISFALLQLLKKSWHPS